MMKGSDEIRLGSDRIKRVFKAITGADRQTDRQEGHRAGQR